MKLWLVTICLIVCSYTFAQSRINVIPAPHSIVEKNGEFRYDPQTRIYAPAEFTGQAKLLQEILGNSGQRIEDITRQKPVSGIVIEKIRD
jgi:hypothetical protein